MGDEFEITDAVLAWSKKSFSATQRGLALHIEQLRSENQRLTDELRRLHGDYETVREQNQRLRVDRDKYKRLYELRECEGLAAVSDLQAARATIASLEAERVQWAERDKRREELYAKKLRPPCKDSPGTTHHFACQCWEDGRRVHVERETLERAADAAESCLPALHCQPWFDAQRAIAATIRSLIPEAKEDRLCQCGHRISRHGDVGCRNGYFTGDPCECRMKGKP